MCSLHLKNNFLTIEGVRFASISKKTPLSKLSFAFVSLALPLLIVMKFFFKNFNFESAKKIGIPRKISRGFLDEKSIYNQIKLLFHKIS